MLRSLVHGQKGVIFEIPTKHVVPTIAFKPSVMILSDYQLVLSISSTKIFFSFNLIILCIGYHNPQLTMKKNWIVWRISKACNRSTLPLQYTIKNSVPEIRYLFWSCWPVEFHIATNITSDCHWFLLPSTTWW